ncbi:hypothetical protein K504DRAFT_347471, partial [Pleomassaria siparia CBS 279.74]
PLHRLSTDDRGSIIIIVAYSWIFITVIVGVIRFTQTWKQKLSFRVDDSTFLLGAVSAFAVVSSVFAHLSANGGLGKRMKMVDERDLEYFYKMMWVAELTGIVAMTFAKTSITLLSHRVSPRKPYQYYSMLGIVAIWSMLSLFGIGFQCGVPHPWVYVPSNCPGRRVLLYPIIVLNILTDALLALWIVPTLIRLLMDTGKRVTVVILFGARLLVCGFAIVQLVSVAQYIRKADVTYNSLGNILWGLCTAHLSVLLATVPRTNRFIEALQTMHTSTLITEYEL